MITMKHFWALTPTVCVLAALGIGACTTPQDENLRTAQEIWKGHEAIVAQAIDGKEHDTDEFMRAIEFFRQVSGIEIDVEIFTLGYMPTAETSNDLDLVHAWFEANGDRLYYDPETKNVRLL